jgi:hypothetical protein
MWTLRLAASLCPSVVLSSVRGWTAHVFTETSRKKRTMPFGEAILSWNRNGESDLAGYRIYYGLSADFLPNDVDVGLTATPLTPTVTLPNAQHPDFRVFGTLFFTVKAYDTSNNESDGSNVVNKGIAPKLFPVSWG